MKVKKWRIDSACEGGQHTTSTIWASGVLIKDGFLIFYQGDRKVGCFSPRNLIAAVELGEERET